MHYHACVFVVCAQDGQQVGQGHTLHLKDATYETTGEYVCEVTVPSLPSLHTSGTVHIIVQGQLFHQPPGRLGVTCHVRRGFQKRDFIQLTLESAFPSGTSQSKRTNVCVSRWPSDRWRGAGGAAGGGGRQDGEPELRGSGPPAAQHLLEHRRQSGGSHSTDVLNRGVSTCKP